MTQTFYQALESIKDYSPVNYWGTSREEYNLISDKLELRTLDKMSLQNLRDMTVMLYSMKTSSAREKGDMDKFDFYNNAMMSITAVIDDFIYCSK